MNDKIKEHKFILLFFSISTVLAISILAFIFFGHKPVTKVKIEPPKPVLGNITVRDLKLKYKTIAAETIKPIYNVSPKQTFSIVFNAVPSNVNVESLVSIHTSSNCNSESKITCTIQKENQPNGTCLVKVYPPESSLFDIKTESDTWGGLSKFYIKISYSMNSTNAIKLATPIVVPFTTLSNIDAPTLKYDINKRGEFVLSWNKVQGTGKYRIYKVNNYTGNQKNGLANAFKNEKIELLAETESLEYFSGEAEVNAEAIKNNGYFITAVSNMYESNLSNYIDMSPITPTLMTKCLYPEQKVFDTIDSLPSSLKIVLASGEKIDKPIEYDFSSLATKPSNSEQAVAENGTTEPLPNVIQFKIAGTPFVGSFEIKNFTKNEITNFKKTHEPQPAGGDTVVENNTQNAPKKSETQKSTEGTVSLVYTDTDGTIKINAYQEANKTEITAAEQKILPVVNSKYKINSDSAFEEYLAINLINCEKEVSIEAFPEGQDVEYLSDVLMKVLYQNPLILYVNMYTYNYSSKMLVVSYEIEDKNIVAQKQNDIFNKAKIVSAKIIGQDMPEIEKIDAIYNYLNANAIYDYDALENAKNKDFKTSDKQYLDSFNAYGVLINKKGVCSSYAAAFKLFCDLQNINCIVASGNMFGTTHTWNKVKIGKDWFNIDSTNNETNTGVPFAVYKASDAAIMNIVQQDTLSVLDNLIGTYVGNSDTLDYYTANNLNFSTIDQYINIVAEHISNGEKTIILRAVNNNIQFDELYKKVATQLRLRLNINLSDYTIGKWNNFVILKNIG